MPVDSNVGTTDHPLVVAGPYLKLTWAFPADYAGDALNPPLVFTGKVRIYRKTREFSRDILDVTYTAGVHDPQPEDKGTLVYEADYSGNVSFGGADPDEEIEREAYLDEFAFLDHEIVSGVVYYYTAYFETSAPIAWWFDPRNGHSRCWAYGQHFRDDGTGENYSPHGDELFNYLPRYWKIKDFKEGDDSVYRMTQAMGRILDTVKEEVDFFKAKGIDVGDVDFARLPYIDWLLAWPTNYELPETRRRIETEQAVPLWKSKGTIDALELVLQTVTGWDISVYEGWKWVLTQNPHTPYDGAVKPGDPGGPPDGDVAWVDAEAPSPEAIESPFAILSSTPVTIGPDEFAVVELDSAHHLEVGPTSTLAVKIDGHEGALPDDLNRICHLHEVINETTIRIGPLSAAQTDAGTGGTLYQIGDGVWSEKVASLPFLTLYDSTDPIYAQGTGTVRDRKTYLPSSEIIIDNGGVGWPWQNNNGVAIVLEPPDYLKTTGAFIPLTEVIVRKIYRIAPLFAMHYAAFQVMVDLLDVEEPWKPLGFDSATGLIEGLNTESWMPLGTDVAHDSTPGVCHLYSWPHPEYPWGSVLGSYEFRTHHNWLEYLCDIFEEGEFMPQFITLSTSELVDQTSTSASVGQFTFDPTTYSGSREFHFGANIVVGGATAGSGLGLQVLLYNLTDGEEVDTTSLETTESATHEQVLTGALTVGSDPGNLQDTLKTYEVRIQLDNEADPTDFGHVGTSYIMVT